MSKMNFLPLEISTVDLISLSEALEETEMDISAIAVLPNQLISGDENKLLTLYKRAVKCIKAHRNHEEFKILHLSFELCEKENEILEALVKYGQKDYLPLICNFYIEAICQKVMQLGRKLSLQNFLAESPFKSYAEFNKLFRKNTGFTLQEFINYSEKRLKKNSQNSNFQQSFSM